MLAIVWKIPVMPLQIYAMIADLKVREHSIGYLRNDTNVTPKRIPKYKPYRYIIVIIYTWRQRKDAT